MSDAVQITSQSGKLFSVRNIRLATGLVLFVFVTLHLCNHALGLISLEAMEAMRDWRVAITRSWPGSIILLTSALAHSVLGLEKILSRRIGAMSMRGIAQIVTGIAIPILLARHIIGTRIAHEAFSINDNYEYALWAMWPTEAVLQGLLITLVWMHGTIGLYMWIRFKTWFKPLQGLLLATAVLVPALGFLGFAGAGRRFQAQNSFPNPFNADQAASIVSWMEASVWLAVVLIGGVAVIKVVQWSRFKLKPKVRVTYNGSVNAEAPEGYTLLEISQAAQIPHASVCGGLARCSTCRVQVVSGADTLAPPDILEARTLRRAGIVDTTVRLACQLRPRGHISVIPLVPAQRTRGRTRGDDYDRGIEKTVTLMFVDIRGFTKFSEGRLPYDIVHVLNQYVGAMSDFHL